MTAESETLLSAGQASRKSPAKPVIFGVTARNGAHNDLSGRRFIGCGEETSYGT
jgi:hypothetical protein